MFDRYYDILDLNKDASQEDIKNRYRQLAKKYHPDVSREKDAPDLFIKISEAYEVLMNRKIIDDLKATSTLTAEQRYAYDYFIHQAREKAKMASEMRYENLRKKHEAFQESGMYDLMLLLEYIFNYFLILLAFFFISFPAYLTSRIGFNGLFILWIPAVFLILYIKNKGKTFFVPGTFFYHISDLKQLIKDESGTGLVPCQYCKNKPADAYPYKISLLKVHDINLQFAGILQHRALYKRSYKKFQIPRCRKAYRVHTAIAVIKVMLILTAILIVPFESLVWRIITGMFTAGILAALILAVTGVRSKVSYLLNRNVIAKILAWIFLIAFFTDFSGFPEITTSEYLLAGILFMLFFQDLMIDPLVKLFCRKGNSRIPILEQPESIKTWYRKGYQSYLEIPIWSTVFPILKWIF